DKNNRLQFSFVGYKKIIVEPQSNTVNVNLEIDAIAISDIVVTAKGKTSTGFMSVDDRDLVAPVQKISAKEFEDVQASSIDEALQGRLSGVDITSNSGDPGSGMSIRIRGVSTLSANSQPLIIVDNVPYETDIASDFNFSTANEQGYSQMLNIPVDDIKEITVLKDAASTAMWGTKAANGVLMITTKRGGKARKPTITLNYRGSYSFNPKHIPLLSGDQYSTLIQEAWLNSYGYPLPTATYKEFLYSPDDPFYYHNYSKNTDWVDAITRDGINNTIDFSITGGGNKAAYRFSTNYYDQVGTTIGSGFNRLTARLNLDYTISDKLKMRADFSVAHSTTSSNYDDGSRIRSSRGTDVRSIAYKKMPNMSIYEYDSYGNLTGDFFSPESNSQGTFPSTYNPVAMAHDAINQTVGDRITTKYSLYYDIVEGLRYTADLSFDVNSSKNTKFLPQTASGQDWTNQWVNKSQDYDSDSYVIYTNNMLSYGNTFNEIHDISAVWNWMTHESVGSAYKIWTANSASNSLQDPANPSKVNESGLGPETSLSRGRSFGTAMMVNYKFDDKYIFTVGMRYEGNSKFDPENRYFFFPSLSLAWRISGENFMQQYSHWMNDIRLRFSYGQTGNPPRYEGMYYSNVSSFGYGYMGYSAIYQGSMALKSLKWESITNYNYGLTIDLFDGRIYTEFDYYYNKTVDMFGYNQPVQSTSGYSRNSVVNMGAMDNMGWDWTVKTIPIQQNDLMVTFDFNIARNYNVLRKLTQDYSLIRNETIGNGQYQNIASIGNPAGSFYGYKYEGVYLNEEDLYANDANGNRTLDPNGNPIKMYYDYNGTQRYEFEVGDAKYKDVNNDGNIDANDIQYLGNANPLFTGGFGSMVKYKNFSINGFFYYRYGNSIINRTKMNGEAMYNFDNQLASTLKRWRKPGDGMNGEEILPRALYRKGYNYAGSDRFVEDGSFLRLKYVTLTYRFPKRFCNSLGVNNIRTSVTANNLFTFTNYSGQDPEISISSSDDVIYTVGYDDSRTPRTREVTFVLSVTF
nr:SusC/RagA family TonB-linked outer membrane protein [Prolixibacteraceae bacterium]